MQPTGGVVLFHVIHPQTPRVRGDVLLRLKRHGLTVVTTDELLRQNYAEARPPAVG